MREREEEEKERGGEGEGNRQTEGEGERANEGTKEKRKKERKEVSEARRGTFTCWPLRVQKYARGPGQVYADARYCTCSNSGSLQVQLTATCTTVGFP